MPIDVFTADEIRRAMKVYAGALRDHREAINRLNVYPVPDGDTGTNMALTLEAVCNELDLAATDMASTCKAIAHGSLMGARGNSGVILSQILRGTCDVLREHETCDASVWAEALRAASDAAYGAVMRPVEGTILTVVRESAEAARAAAERGAALVEVLERARDAGGRALERTPELLPVLAEAGVVDAGGAGLLLLLDALAHVIDGRPMPVPTEDEGRLPAGALVAGGHGGPSADHRNAESGEKGVSDLRYEVMYFLEAPDEAVPGFKDVWATVGDSIVVVGGDGLWNCHIHTDDIGAAIEAGIDIGRPRNIRVTDLLEQVEEERWVREAEPLPPEPAAAHEPVPCAVVAVATGDGVRRIFYSLGVQGIVTGGQTMNPSTAQLLEAVERAPADEVVILPNNKNIIPVAEQVGGQTSKRVYVVPTRGVAEGFASLLAYDPQASGEDNARAMAEAAANVIAGEVTRAVRDSSCDLGPIAEGDYIGLGRDGIVAVAPSLDDACTQLLDALVRDDHEIVTIIEGEGATAATTRHIELWLQDHRPNVTAEVHHGGQPLYPYLFGIE
ncbi:DAK2 domain-containing protein [Rhabdothermincola sediminis]|uniref:DAK2 domain-containing protein n=1 Tax=Rhabdothermincola sediminis TaxID=2751370 RepID=UPI001AA06E98|nr:DAK2 domain-containing protein [Rhabdothermincola sediminis]